MKPGRLLYLGMNYEPAIGGAEVTDQLLLESWVRRGGEAGAIQWGKGEAHRLRGVDIYRVSDAQQMKAAALTFAPDLIYSQVGTHGVGLEVARQLGVPAITCLHDARPLCPDLVAQARCDQLCSLCPHGQERPVHVTKALIQQFDRILVPSEFMAGLVRSLLGRQDVSVLHPAVDPVHLERATEGSIICMVSAERIKGADTFLEVARRMPEQTFLLAGRGKAKSCGYDPRLHPNVRVVGSVPREELYQDSWLVLMPSRWAEPFGRMAPEAQSAGVLFMGSRIGGIPEAAGDAGVFIDAIEDPDAWVSAIRDLQQDPARQAFLRTRGREAWKRFEAQGITDQFCQWVETIMDRGVERPRSAAPPIPSPWHITQGLKQAYYGSLALALLGTFAWRLGAPAQVAQVSLGGFLICLLVVWGLHAGPLMLLRGKAARRSGIRLLVLGGLFLGALGTLLFGCEVRTVLIVCLAAMAITSYQHYRRARLERFRTTGM